MAIVVPRSINGWEVQERSGGRVRLFHNAIGFDLNQPRGIDEARNLHKRASGANVAEDVAVRASCITPSRNVSQHDPRPNDIRYCPPSHCDSFPNDFKATDRLPVDITWSRGTPRKWANGRRRERDRT
jgi:hypothetical protein